MTALAVTMSQLVYDFFYVISTTILYVATDIMQKYVVYNV
jgi:hypothetical protein